MGWEGVWSALGGVAHSTGIEAARGRPASVPPVAAWRHGDIVRLRRQQSAHVLSQDALYSWLFVPSVTAQGHILRF